MPKITVSNSRVIPTSYGISIDVVSNPRATSISIELGNVYVRKSLYDVI